LFLFVSGQEGLFEQYTEVRFASFLLQAGLKTQKSQRNLYAIYKPSDFKTYMNIVLFCFWAGRAFWAVHRGAFCQFPTSGWLEKTKKSTQPLCYLYWKESK
jgi:hypothetical protein